MTRPDPDQPNQPDQPDPGFVDEAAIDAVQQRIAGAVLRTPLIPSPALSDLTGLEIYLKPELLQPTGSFKVRGVFAMLAGLDDAQRRRGVLAFSAGNHAMAVAYAAGRAGVAVTVCMPAGAVAFKVDAVRAMGARLELVEGDLVARAHELAQAEQLTLLHPFDHPAVVAGTATIGREIVADLPQVAAVIVPVGGGGLISGVATAVKRARPQARVIGVEPEGADVVSRSLAAGEAVTLRTARSVADGLSAPIAGAVNLVHIRRYVDEVVRVSEDQILTAWRAMVRRGKLAAEPAGAAGLAAVLGGGLELDPPLGPVVLVVGGGNTDLLAGADA
ncbi:MAG: threonine/serine dehydratase [Kineosporiaceae bacterium]